MEIGSYIAGFFTGCAVVGVLWFALGGAGR